MKFLLFGDIIYRPKVFFFCSYSTSPIDDSTFITSVMAQAVGAKPVTFHRQVRDTWFGSGLV